MTRLACLACCVAVMRHVLLLQATTGLDLKAITRLLQVQMGRGKAREKGGWGREVGLEFGEREREMAVTACGGCRGAGMKKRREEVSLTFNQEVCDAWRGDACKGMRTV